MVRFKSHHISLIGYEHLPYTPMPPESIPRLHMGVSRRREEYLSRKICFPGSQAHPTHTRKFDHIIIFISLPPVTLPYTPNYPQK